MSNHSFSDLVLYFTIYSFIGWFCETLYCSIPARKRVSRGFLHGPYCPVYGFGALLILLPLEPLRPYPVAVFLLGMLLTSMLEYITGWLLEKLFGIRWWDYSGRKFNLRGRVCLLNSVLFGFMGVAMVYVIHPMVALMISRIPNNYERALSSLVVVLFLFDLLLTLSTLIGLEEKLRKLQAVVAELKAADQEYSWFDEHDLPGSLERLKALGSSVSESLLERLESIGKLQGNLKRILRSFPDMRHMQNNETLQLLRTNLEAKRAAQKEKWNRRLWSFTKRVGAKTGTAVKEGAKSFASGINFYKLCWVFFLSCVIGCFLETLFCLVMNGYVESRQGMIYGPFNQVYGFGAVIMVLLLHRLAKYKDRWIFLGSALIGGAFEYVCSLVQENMFGSVSWEYSEHQFNIAGRTSLTYMFFWGILGVVLIKGIYPWMSRIIERIPNRQGTFFTWVLLIVLSTDLLLSAVAVTRWSERQDGLPPENSMAEWLDENYPDDFLEEVYPNMQFR